MTCEYIHNTWFRDPGAYVLVDGQFGSTGKGLFAGFLAGFMRGRVNKITTNAGPNSGHTAYFSESNYNAVPHTTFNTKIVTQQLPVASVFLDKWGERVDTILNAGAIIDYGITLAELAKWCNQSGSRVLIHPSAALITEEDRKRDQDTLSKIASTGKGIGPAMAMKLLRTGGRDVTARAVFPPFLPPGYPSWDNLWDWGRDVVFVETAQGFSLGLNSGRFYPHVTSRECTVMQALADARIPAQKLIGVACTFRTYPIRVGNTENNSGGWYPDQEETTWEALGLAQELTTVTKRVRRVATFSEIQFTECIATNRPDILFMNFCNYLPRDKLRSLVMRTSNLYRDVMGYNPPCYFLGFGPYSSDVMPAGDYFQALGLGKVLG